jgi:hypothetical protein
MPLEVLIEHPEPWGDLCERDPKRGHGRSLAVGSVQTANPGTPFVRGLAEDRRGHALGVPAFVTSAHPVGGIGAESGKQRVRLRRQAGAEHDAPLVT